MSRREYRPISLINSIVQVLANSLREVISDLGCPFLSAFFSRRQLLDGLIVAREILVVWLRKATRGFMWKVDLAKAYDSVFHVD